MEEDLLKNCKLDISVSKRDGRIVNFDIKRVYNVVYKSFAEIIRDSEDKSQNVDTSKVEDVAKMVFALIQESGVKKISVETIQDFVIESFDKLGYTENAKKYSDYRTERALARRKNSRLYKKLKEITFQDLSDSEIKKENGNINGNSAMGVMLRYGSESSKEYILDNIMNKRFSVAHREGFIHIHDLDFYSFTTTCTQIDIVKLFEEGFNTGHGFIRPPQSIESAAALCAIIIQSNQNDQHGGQSIPNFDYGLAKFVKITFNKVLKSEIEDLAFLNNKTEEEAEKVVKNCFGDNTRTKFSLDEKQEFVDIASNGTGLSDDAAAVSTVFELSVKKTNRRVYQAMESLIFNLNTLHSRCGAQVPFSTLNYGTDTSPEARMLVRNLLEVTERGLGKGETPIFPIQIFRVMKGINYNEGDPNYDLFKQAIRVSSKRFFPNWEFEDATFNKSFYVEGRPETLISTMGCRTRVMADNSSPDNQQTYGRGNLSFTSINLPRIAIINKGNIDGFFSELEKYLLLTRDQLLERYSLQCSRKAKNFPFLMEQGVWQGSENLNPEDTLESVLKHGTLSIGFIGLAECLLSLVGKHHGESAESQELGLRIVRYMRDLCDRFSKETGLNFSLLATPAEGLSGRFTEMDVEKFGIIPKVNDHGFYTNSSHVPVDFKTTTEHKIQVEAPYHELENAGHILYCKMNGDPSKNLEAYEKIIRTMCENNVGYGAINFDQDHCKKCGHIGLIGDECPECKAKDADGYIERIRRITGYLVGDTKDRWNKGKLAELKARENV